jgi:hypothetical protein
MDRITHEVRSAHATVPTPEPASPAARPALRLGVDSPEADAALTALGGTVAIRPDGAEWRPDDPDAGRVRVVHDLGPLGVADAAVQTATAELRARATGVAIAESRRLVSREGEYARLGRIAGRLGDAPFELHVGVVLGDASYAEIQVLARHDDLIPRFRRLAAELVAGYQLGLGDLRRRRFLHQTPPGWDQQVRHAATVWIAPDHARRHGVLTISDAIPERACSRDDAVADAFAGCSFPLAPATRRRIALTTAAGLRGDYVAVVARTGDRIIEVVALGDGRYVYRLALEAALDGLTARRRLLEAVVASIEPLPAPRARPRATPGLAHWAD